MTAPPPKAATEATVAAEKVEKVTTGTAEMDVTGKEERGGGENGKSDANENKETGGVDTAHAEAQAEDKDASEAKNEAKAGGSSAEGDDVVTPAPVVPAPHEPGATAGETVAKSLGEEVGKLYTEAMAKSTGKADMESLTEATALFVKALQQISGEKTVTAGYGELALGYGKALLTFVVKGATSGGVLGGDVEGELTKGRAVVEEDVDGTVAEKDGAEEDIEQEESDEELTWTQLELARVTFEKVTSHESEHAKKYVERLAEAHMTLGEFLLACDQASGAGDEFNKAAGMWTGRQRAESMYKRYLALRQEDRAEAVRSLQESVAVLEKVEQDLGAAGKEEEVKDVKEVLQEMREELRVVAESVEKVGTGSGDGGGVGSGGSEAKVVTKVVVPKRKRKDGEGGAGGEKKAKVDA